MTTDEMKMSRDGHLEFGKVPSSKHAWVRSIWEIVKVTDTEVHKTLGPGSGTFVFERKSPPPPTEPPSSITPTPDTP
jgi:hypothetical protein